MKPSWVVDTSVALKWVFVEEDSDKAGKLADGRLFAPRLLLVEAANAIWRKASVGDLTAQAARLGFDILLDAPVRYRDDNELLAAALPLAIELEHPYHDCLYLALAIALDAPLITADKRFEAAIRRHGAHDARVAALRDLPEPF